MPGIKLGIILFVAAFVLWLIALNSALALFQKSFNECRENGGDRAYCATGLK